MNEIRDLIVGIDFGKEYSQICYYCLLYTSDAADER